MFRWICLAVAGIALVVLGWFLYDLRQAITPHTEPPPGCKCPVTPPPVAPQPVGSTGAATVNVTVSCESHKCGNSCGCVNACTCGKPDSCGCKKRRSCGTTTIPAPVCSSGLVTVPVGRIVVCEGAPAAPACVGCPPLNAKSAELVFTGGAADASLRWVPNGPSGCGWYLVTSCGELELVAR